MMPVPEIPLNLPFNYTIELSKSGEPYLYCTCDCVKELVTGDSFCIASICYFAWKECAFELEKRCNEEGRVHLRYGISDEPEYVEWERRQSKAEEWRKWGEERFGKLK